MSLPEPQNVSKQNIMMVIEEDVKAEQREDMAKAMDEFRAEFLKLFSKTKSGEVIKKFPPLSPHNIVIHEDPGKLSEMVNEALHHALINQSDVMTNETHNAVVQALRSGEVFQGFKGPTYKMLGPPNRSAHTTFEAAAGESSVTQPIQSEGVCYTLPQQFSTPLPQQSAPQPPVFTTSPPLIASSAQGVSGNPIGWDPKTGFGMPPDFGGTSANTSLEIPPRPPSPRTPAPRLASLYQMHTPNTGLTCTLVHHQDGIKLVLHDPTTGLVRHLEIPPLQASPQQQPPPQQELAPHMMSQN
jgi:hypothetical protein